MELEQGSVVEARVVKITPFGAFVELPGGEEGLIHISQIAHEYVQNVRDYLNEGDIVQVLVKGRDHKGRLDLSLKDLTPAPEGAPPPRPKRLPRQAPEFENKLKSFLRGTGGTGGKKKGKGRRR